MGKIHIIGIDPGKHCGLARLYGTLHESLVVEPTSVIPVLRSWIEDDRAIICLEQFVVGKQTTRKSRQNDVIDIIGAVKSFCGEYELICTMQGSSAAKRMGNKTVLKKLGWWTSGYETDHANDASSHVLLGVAQHHPAVMNRLQILVESKS